jgi:hypothetical protein
MHEEEHTALDDVVDVHDDVGPEARQLQARANDDAAEEVEEEHSRRRDDEHHGGDDTGAASAVQLPPISAGDQLLIVPRRQVPAAVSFVCRLQRPNHLM